MAVTTTDVSSSLYFSSFDDGATTATTHTYNNVDVNATDENVLLVIGKLTILQTNAIDETGRINRADITSA
jgi:hypothetical protein